MNVTKQKLSRLSAMLFAFGSLLAAGGAYADTAASPDVVEEHLTLSNHAFDPQSLTVPAGKKIKLIVVNKDASAAEFESEDMSREKVIPANGQIYVYIDPLKAGTYSYVDDFHRTTTTGTIIAQ